MNILAIDLETSSLDSKNGAILEIAAIPIIDGVKKEPFLTYVKPHIGAVIDDQALRINGIKRDQFDTFPDLETVITDFIKFLDQYEVKFTLLGQNVKFDIDFLYTAFSRLALHTQYVRRFRPKRICTKELAEQIFLGKKVRPEKLNLASLCKFFNVKLENHHSALFDITATYEVFLHLDSMRVKIPRLNQEMSYLDKIDHYFGNPKYIQINPDGTVFISKEATKDMEAMKVISQELYNVYGC